MNVRASGFTRIRPGQTLSAATDALIFVLTLVHPTFGVLALWLCAGLMRRLQISKR